MFKNSKMHLKNENEVGLVILRLHHFGECVNCKHPHIPVHGIHVGQRYQCQDCDEIMVIPLGVYLTIMRIIKHSWMIWD